MAIKHSIWTITAKTHLHVGNENSDNFGIIDKAVQRDPVTDLPCINASSLKGALNEHFSKLSPGAYFAVFGSDKADSKKESTKGLCSFFDATMIAIPKQRNDDYLFDLCTSDQVLADANGRARIFGKTIDLSNSLRHPLSGAAVERVANIKDLCDDFGLPIIARNRVGEKRNLWYEQVVPRETVFVTIISYPDDNQVCADFVNALANAVVQIGANASVGYGYCQFKRVDQ